MIKDRRNEQVKDSKGAPKKASTSDRAVGGARAKRAAATAARRGMTDTNKPNAMEVEKEVYRQSRRTAATKEKQEQKVSAGRLQPKAKPRNERKKDAGTLAVFGGRTPSKKAIEAAVNGMQAAGFKVPQGMQVIITFVPAPEPPGRKPAAKKNPPAKGGKKPAANQNQGGAGNQNQGGGGNQNQGGRGSRGGGGDRGGRRTRR
jgi:uncharacterized membrane protein YgcG